MDSILGLLKTLEPAILALHVIIAAALVGLVLMQRSEGGGLGMGSQNNAFMSVRGQTNLLTRSTAWLALGFFLTSIVLALAAGSGQRSGTFMQAPPSLPAGPASGAAPPAGPAPAAPAAPATPQAPTR